MIEFMMRGPAWPVLNNISTWSLNGIHGILALFVLDARILPNCNSLDFAL